MDLYTAFLDYRGGTYVVQILADDINQAVVGCVRRASVEVDALQGLRVDFGSDVSFASDPQQLDDCINVWCETMLVEDELLLMHFVRTVQES